jgi:hypothetical protein
MSRHWNQFNGNPGNPFGDMFNSTGSYADHGYTPNTSFGNTSAGSGAYGNAGFGVNSPTYQPGNFDFSTGTGTGTGGSKTPRTADQWKSMGSGISNIIAGFADVSGANDRMAEQRGFANTAKGDIDEFYTDLEAGKYDAKTNQKMLDAFSFGRQKLDINPSLSMMATTMDSITDPRMMSANIGNLNTAATRSMQGLQQQDRQNELANAQQYGQYMGGLQGKNEDFRRGVYSDKLGKDELAYSTSIQNEQAIDEARRQGWGNMVAGGVEMGMSFVGKDGMKIPKFQGGGDVMQQILSSQGEGGVPARQDLPGEESHEANPISMVAENGEVVGEATGGEIILNGEQTEEIENAVAIVDQAIEAGGQPSMEDLMAVYEAVSETLSQPQFQDEQQASPQADPAKEKMMMMLEGGQQMA